MVEHSPKILTRGEKASTTGHYWETKDWMSLSAGQSWDKGLDVTVCWSVWRQRTCLFAGQCWDKGLDVTVCWSVLRQRTWCDCLLVSVETKHLIWLTASQCGDKGLNVTVCLSVWRQRTWSDWLPVSVETKDLMWLAVLVSSGRVGAF